MNKLWLYKMSILALAGIFTAVLQGNMTMAKTDTNSTIYDFTANTIDGEKKSLSDYKGKVVLVVNTASKCGFTPQFEGLEALYMKYGKQGFEILGFPSNQFANQDPGTNSEIAKFCTLNYGVTFQMFEKIDVNGADAHPLYRYLVKQKGSILGDSIKWNFTKFLVNRRGEVVDRFAPTTKPESIDENIAKLLQE
jgi:glutathione peroxidase